MKCERRLRLTEEANARDPSTSERRCDQGDESLMLVNVLFAILLLCVPREVSLRDSQTHTHMDTGRK
uniref:Uncharacterized protein n=1 Tax=Hyaloperonospora arabidopsidis (strain Emoy2) TaxID=559515 RepID=M4BN94_HYAAE